MEETLGARLKRLREERDWTVYEAAKRAGMAPWVLTRLEQRTTLGNVQVASLKRLAVLYNVTIDYLVRDFTPAELVAVGT